MKKWIYILFAFVLLLSSCIARIYVISLDGRVLCNKSEKPIENAQVALEGGRRNVTVSTDSLGIFNLHVYGSGRSPERLFIISKEGYKDFRIRIEHNWRGTRKIYTVERGRVPYTFGGKRFYPDSTNLSTWIGITDFEKYSRDFATRNGRLTFYLDIDDLEVDLQNFLDLWDDGWIIK